MARERVVRVAGGLVVVVAVDVEVRERVVRVTGAVVVVVAAIAAVRVRGGLVLRTFSIKAARDRK